MQHHPSLPPSHPTFKPLLASIPALVERKGTQGAARRLRLKLEAIYEQGRDPERLLRSGVSAFDLSELTGWLEGRIRELEAADA